VGFVLVCAAPVAFGADCRKACEDAAKTCIKRSQREVADCRAAVRERCANACGCDGLEGASLVACLQRCEVCHDMLREGAGIDCDAKERDGRDDCARERKRCEDRCDD